MTHLFLYDREPVVVMRQHHRNMGLAVAKNAEIALATFAFLERQPAFPAALRPVVARARADTLQRLGWWAVRIAEDPPRARDAFARTVAIDPRRSFHPRVLAGRLLSHLSSGQLHRMNRSINTIRRHRGHLDYRRDYFS